MKICCSVSVIACLQIMSLLQSDASHIANIKARSFGAHETHVHSIIGTESKSSLEES